MKKCTWVRPEPWLKIGFLEWTESDHRNLSPCATTSTRVRSRRSTRAKAEVALSFNDSVSKCKITLV